MSTDSDSDGPEYSAGQLRRMDRETAADTLTKRQWDRWEKLNALHDDAEAQREQWAAESDEVVDLTVHADPDDLGTEVDIYGNDVVVHVTEDDDTFRAAAEDLEAEFGDDDRDVSELDASDAERIAECLLTMLDCALVRWNGTPWETLGQAQRDRVLADARQKWGLEGLLYAWVDVAEAIQAEREQRVDVIESFRNPERRGSR
jgi:hypothetical protein